MSDYNAFTKYNNEIKDVKNNFNPDNFISDLVSKVSSLSNAQISKLNSLLGTFSLNIPFKSSAGKQINDLLNAQIDKLKLTATETLSNLSNAAISFAGNIVEEFVKDLKSYQMIPDSINVLTVKALYEAGGDLSYNKDYTRNQALERDWNYTLEFIDDNVGIEYNLEYKKLKTDLKKITKNSCKKNIEYLFDKLYIDYNIFDSELNIVNKRILLIDDVESEDYKELDSYIKYLEKIKLEYEKIFVEYMGELIVYGYDYLTTKDIKLLFEKYNKILKPIYFGTTDNKFNSRYAFNNSDINVMAPFWKNHGTELSVTDQAIIDSNTKNTDEQLAVARENNDKVYEEFLLNKQKYNENLPNSLSNGGENNIYESRAEYTKNSSGSTNDKFALQYKNSTVFEVEKNVYIAPRNTYIKQIYVYLSNTDLHGDDAMYNEDMYKRLKYPYMTAYQAALDKALAYVSDGPLAQGLLKVIDTIEGSIYRYIVSTEHLLLDPKIHFQVINEEELDINVSLPEIDEPNINGNNTQTEDILKEAETDPKNDPVKVQIDTLLRFMNNISMLEKANSFKKYLTMFYNYCIYKGVDENRLKEKFSSMCYGLFNRNDITDPDKLELVFGNITDEQLNTYTVFLISTSFYKLEPQIFSWDSELDYELINAYNISTLLFGINAYIYGFIRTLYLYDSLQLSSATKQFFTAFIKAIKSINTTDNDLYKLFYTFKDIITKYYYDFDESGILMLDNTFTIVNTNVTIGDFNDVQTTSDGTFFLGTEDSGAGILKLTSNNNEIIETNITSGEWVKCFSINGYTFFTNSDDEVYVWNKFTNSITETQLDSNFTDNIDFLYSVNNGINIFAYSKTENLGIRKLNTNTFVFESTNITTGSNWRSLDLENGYYVFSPTSNGLYRFSGSNFTLVDGTSNDTYNNGLEFVETVKITTTTGSGDSSQTQITYETNRYTAFCSNNNKGIRLVSDSDKTDIIQSNISSGSYEYYNYYGNEYIVDYQHGNVSKLFKRLNNDDITNGPNVVYKDDIYTSGSSGELLCIGRNGIYIKMIESSNNTIYSLSPLNANTFTKTTGLTSAEINNIKMYDNYDKQHTLVIGPNLEGIRVLVGKDTEFKDVPYAQDENIDKSKNWTVYTNSSDTYLLSSDYPDTFVKVLSIINNDIKMIDTNLISKNWEIIDFNNKGIALSKNGNNKGIYIKDSQTTFNKTFIEYYDFSSYSIYNNKLYIGTYRKQDLLNLDSVNYNVDEFIYYLNDLEKQNVIINSVKGFLDAIEYNLTNDNSIFNINSMNLENLLTMINLLLTEMILIENNLTIYSLLGSTNLLDGGLSKDFDIDDKVYIKSLIDYLLLNSPSTPGLRELILRLLGINTIVNSYFKTINREDFSTDEEYLTALNNYMKTIDMCSDTYLDEDPYNP